MLGTVISPSHSRPRIVETDGMSGEESPVEYLKRDLLIWCRETTFRSPDLSGKYTGSVLVMRWT
jgi:hypothetical protein